MTSSETIIEVWTNTVPPVITHHMTRHRKDVCSRKKSPPTKPYVVFTSFMNGENRFSDNKECSDFSNILIILLYFPKEHLATAQHKKGEFTDCIHI